MSNSWLRITDGTDTVDLLDLHGWLLKEWKPSVPEPKGGGVFRNSPINNGRQLAYRAMDNITDTFNMVAIGQSQGQVIATIKKLQRLLEKAVAYYTTGWQNESVWIEAREPCEDKIRYAPIIDYRLNGFGSPYQQPFFGRRGKVANEALLTIEHKFWQDTVPGEDGYCVELHNRTDYPSVANYDSGTFSPNNSLSDETYSNMAALCNYTAHTLGIGYTSFPGKAESGVIFDNVTIPVGATIKSAILRLTVTSADPLTSVQVRGQSQVGGKINSVTLVSGGHDYVHPVVHVLSASGGSGATIVATVVGGVITELTITNPGTGYISPYIQIYDTTAPAGGAIATCTATAANVDATLFDGTSIDFLARTRTAAYSPSANLSVGVVDVSVTNVVAEIIENINWASGDDLGLFMTLGIVGDDSDHGAEFSSFDEGADYPQLLVEWTTDVVQLGRDTTCAQEVFISNKHNNAPIKYILCNDSSGATWSPNMLEWNYAAANMPLFQDDTGTVIVPGNGDAIYFGSCPIDTLDTDYGPFCSLILDIYSGQIGISDGVWEYWSGAAWTAFDVSGTYMNELCGNNTMLDKTGVTSLVWKQSSNWEENTVTDGVYNKTGYWIRFRIITAAGATSPYQQHRDIYTALQPFIDIDGDKIPGDISALAKIKFDAATCSQRSMNTLVLGLRSLSRGEDFDAYLNVSDKQQPDGIDFTIEDSYLVGDMIDSPATPTGRMLVMNDFDAYGHGYRSFTPVCSWTITGELARQYVGVYHAYIRCEFPLSAVGGVKLRLRSVFGDEYNVCYSEEGAITTGLYHCCVDVGQFSIMPLNILSSRDVIGSAKIYIDAYSEDDVDWNNAYITDVILIPADEWSGNFGMPKLSGTAVLMYDYGLEIDGITIPRQYRAVEVYKQNNITQIVAEWSRIASSEPIFQSNEDQRLWFLQYFHGSGVSNIENSGAVCAERSSRYILTRGDE